VTSAKATTRAAVIGAGPLGLTLAHLLADHGWSVTVYEADDRTGGMSATFDFDGVRMERYYHFINRPDAHFIEFLGTLGLGDRLQWRRTTMGWAVPGTDGRPVVHPWGNPVALLRFPGASLVDKLRYGGHAFSCKFLRDLDALDGKSVREWIVQWEGQDNYDRFWRPLFERKFFELQDPLSAAWIASRIRRVANSRESLMHESLGYLQGGTQVFLDRLEESIRKRGGDIRLSSKVRRVSPKPGKSGCEVEADNDIAQYDHVILTIPLPYLAGILPDMPTAYRKKVEGIANIGCVCVLFRLAEAVTPHFWCNLDMPGWDVPGLIEYSNLRPMDAAHVYVPFYMPHTHPNWPLEEKDIIAKARGYLAAVNPKAAATEQAARAFRYEYAQPVCPPGFKDMLPGYDTGLDGILAADTSHAFPEDRSITECIRIAKELADLATSTEVAKG
jgi:protoporphyrinogen oxidase